MPLQMRSMPSPMPQELWSYPRYAIPHPAQDFMQPCDLARWYPAQDTAVFAHPTHTNQTDASDLLEPLQYEGCGVALLVVDERFAPIQESSAMTLYPPSNRKPSDPSVTDDTMIAVVARPASLTLSALASIQAQSDAVDEDAVMQRYLHDLDRDQALESDDLDIAMPIKDEPAAGGDIFAYGGFMAALLAPTIDTNGPMAPLSTSSSSPTSSTCSTGSTYSSAWPRPTISPTATKSKGKRCIEPGCVRRVQSNSRCKAHGGGPRCQYVGPGGCTRSSQGGGLCRAHGGGKRCEVLGCTRGQQRHRRCYMHGGIRQCEMLGCEKKDRGNGYCIAHGGGKRCQSAGCSRSSQGGGFCRAHGGGKRCEVPGCTSGQQRNGRCFIHGGIRKCRMPECEKKDRGNGFCVSHGGGKALPSARSARMHRAMALTHSNFDASA